MSSDQLEAHELSSLFPLITGDDFTLMVKDMQANGQREPIILFSGKIIDGRNRYRACRELGLEPLTKEYTGDDPLGLVLSLNMHRRQLTVAQRAIVAAEMIRRKREMEAADAGKMDGGHNADSSIPGVDDAAKALGISPRSVSAALRVFKNGTEALCEAVKRGEIRVSSAEQVTKLSLEEQQSLCEKGPRAIAKAARELRETAKKTAKPAVSRPEPGKGAKTLEVVEPADIYPEHIATSTERKASAQRMFELSEEGMMEGWDAESVAEEILCDLEDGLDTQTLLFAVEVALKLKERLAVRQHRR